MQMYNVSYTHRYRIPLIQSLHMTDGEHICNK